MTYKLDPIVNLIDSPIKVIFPDSNAREYSCGDELAQGVFEKLYKIQRITADANILVLELEETQIEAVKDPFI